jgi:hypothetical protein
MVQGQPGKILFETPPMSKIKWTGTVAQVVEQLLCKCEALISNPSSTKKKKKVE